VDLENLLRSGRKFGPKTKEIYDENARGAGRDIYCDSNSAKGRAPEAKTTHARDRAIQLRR